MNPEHEDTETRVATRIRKAVSGLDREHVLTLFEGTFGALIRRAGPSLGPVVLSAVLERVIYNSSQRFPFLQGITVKDSAIQFEAFLKDASKTEIPKLSNAIEFAFTEFFSIVDRLSGEILTPGLYAEFDQSLFGRDSAAVRKETL